MHKPAVPAPSVQPRGAWRKGEGLCTTFRLPLAAQRDHRQLQCAQKASRRCILGFLSRSEPTQIQTISHCWSDVASDHQSLLVPVPPRSRDSRSLQSHRLRAGTQIAPASSEHHLRSAALGATKGAEPHPFALPSIPVCQTLGRSIPEVQIHTRDPSQHKIHWIPFPFGEGSPHQDPPQLIKSRFASYTRT